MRAGGWARPVHRWTSIVFTLAVIANFVARGMGQGEPPAWITYSPLPPLFLQLFTGCICLRCTTGAELSVRAPRRHLEAVQQRVTQAVPAGVMGPAERTPSGRWVLSSDRNRWAVASWRWAACSSAPPVR